MHHILPVLLCLSLLECATVPKAEPSDKRIAELQEALFKKDAEIKLKNSQLNDKDLEIGWLLKKLEGFGVFE